MRSAFQLMALLFFMSCGSAVTPGKKMETAKVASSSLTNYDLDHLLRLRDRVRAGEADYQKPYRKMVRHADELLTRPLASVMDKTTTPPSGDKHDYLSLAPYWWPDPAKEGGLPWIRRDGEINPATKGDNTDKGAKDRAFNIIEDLSWAAFFSGEKHYADRAVAQLDVFFVDEATRMNANLNFGQGIPGRNTGRCFGIIETAGLQNIVTALELLKLDGHLPQRTEAAMREWLADYCDWLETSKLGVKEGTRKNNHANWYDAQLVCMQRYLGQNEKARARLEAAKSSRIATQIEPDGSQPLELARTKSIDYSAMSLRALTRLAWHGKHLGVDLWNYRTEDGRGIQTAYDYLKPYAFDGNPWEYQQLGDVEKELRDLRQLFYRTGAIMDVPEYCALREGPANPPRNMRDLLFVCD